nr:3814_t:CDS:2 [Entrophospora candida]
MFESIYFIFLSIAIIGAINSILLLYYNSVRKSYHAIGVNTDHKTYQDVGVQTDESTSLQQESSLSSSEDNTIADINNDVVSVDSLTEPVDLETSKGLIIVNLESESDIDDELNIMTNNTNTVIAKSIVEDNESNDDVSTNDSDIDDEYDSTDNTTKSDDDIIQGNNCLMQVAHVEYVESEISTNNTVVNYNVVNNAVNNNVDIKSKENFNYSNTDFSSTIAELPLEKEEEDLISSDNNDNNSGVTSSNATINVDLINKSMNNDDIRQTSNDQNLSDLENVLGSNGGGNINIYDENTNSKENINYSNADFSSTVTKPQSNEKGDLMLNESNGNDNVVTDSNSKINVDLTNKSLNDSGVTRTSNDIVFENVLGSNDDDLTINDTRNGMFNAETEITTINGDVKNELDNDSEGVIVSQNGYNNTSLTCSSNHEEPQAETGTKLNGDGYQHVSYNQSGNDDNSWLKKAAIFEAELRSSGYNLDNDNVFSSSSNYPNKVQINQSGRSWGSNNRDDESEWEKLTAKFKAEINNSRSNGRSNNKNNEGSRSRNNNSKRSVNQENFCNSCKKAGHAPSECPENEINAKIAWTKLVTADSQKDLEGVKEAFEMYTKAASHETFQSIETKLRKENCNCKIIAIQREGIPLRKCIADLQGNKGKKYVASLIMVSPKILPRSAGIRAQSEQENFDWLADSGQLVDDLSVPICYICKKRGHYSRDCSQYNIKEHSKFDNKINRANNTSPFNCHKCGSNEKRHNCPYSENSPSPQRQQRSALVGRYNHHHIIDHNSNMKDFFDRSYGEQCYNCGSTGHHIRNCPRSENSPTSSQQQSFMRRDHNNYYEDNTFGNNRLDNNNLWQQQAPAFVKGGGHRHRDLNNYEDNTFGNNKLSNNPLSGKCFKCGSPEHHARSCTRDENLQQQQRTSARGGGYRHRDSHHEGNNTFGSSKLNGNSSNRKCFKCGSPEHNARFCTRSGDSKQQKTSNFVRRGDRDHYRNNNNHY